MRCTTATGGAAIAQQGKLRRGGVHNDDLSKPRFARAYGFALVTGGLFLLSWTGQFFAQLVVERNDAAENGQDFEWGDFLAQFAASTLENWQSEFLQLIWQAVGLRFCCSGAPRSRRSPTGESRPSWMPFLDERGISAQDISAGQPFGAPSPLVARTTGA